MIQKGRGRVFGGRGYRLSRPVSELVGHAGSHVLSRLLAKGTTGQGQSGTLAPGNQMAEPTGRGGFALRPVHGQLGVEEPPSPLPLLGENTAVRRERDAPGLARARLGRRCASIHSCCHENNLPFSHLSGLHYCTPGVCSVALCRFCPSFMGEQGTAWGWQPRNLTKGANLNLYYHDG